MDMETGVLIIFLMVLVPVNPDKVLDMEDIKFLEKLYTAYFCTGEVFESFKLFAFVVRSLVLAFAII